MFLTLQSFHKKNSYKFSSKLTGKNYNNSLFIHSCSRNIDRISSTICASESQLTKQSRRYFVKDAKHQSRTTNLSRGHTRNIKSSHTQYQSFRKQQKLQGLAKVRLNEIKINLQKHPQEKEALKKNVHRRHSQKQEQDAIFTQIREERHKNLKNYTILGKKRLKSPYITLNSKPQGFKFPSIKLKILQRFSTLEEIQAKSLRINSQIIFGKLINKQLMGEYTKYFMEIIQYYIRIIIKNKQINNENDLQAQLKNISKKSQFIEKIKQLREKSQTQKIISLIQYYCIPPENQCKKIMKDFIFNLSMDIYENRNCKKNIQYILMSQEGLQIKHISQIYFSTQSILILPKDSSRQHYSKYQELIKEGHKLKKLNFKQLLKKNFMENIVNNKISEQSLKKTSNQRKYNEQRKRSVTKAENFITQKSKFRFHAKKQAFSKLQYSGDDSEQFIYESPELPKQRRQMAKKQYEQLVRQLRRILDPYRVFPYELQSDQRTQLQFKKLFSLNELYIKNYNADDDNSNKLLVDNLMDNFYLFQNKTEPQKKRINNLINRIYGKNNQRCKQLQFWQFKELYLGMYGIADRQVIMRIVNNYFDFDQYGELQKQTFSKNIQICSSREGRPLNIIVSSIWMILQQHKVIGNNKISKYRLQVWYEPIKFIYFLLISIIFGTQYHSMEEMMFAILAEKTT